MFNQGRAFGSGGPRTTGGVYPDEVCDTEEVREEWKTGGEPYHAIRRWGFDVHGKVKDILKHDLGIFSVADYFLAFVKAFRSEGVESSTCSPLNEVHDRGGP